MLLAAALYAFWRGGNLTAVASGALLAISLGVAVSKIRTEWTRAPVLERRLPSAEVRGIVELVEPAGKIGQRLTLAAVRIAGLAPEDTPKRIRVRAMRGLEGLMPGEAVRLRAALTPPPGPALPGGYDFARTAWYAGLGAVGYTRRPPERDAEPADPPWRLAMRASVERVRAAIGTRVTAALPGESGAIANSLITGERGGISEPTLEAFRDSGLVHVLSISGLHMAIMAGSVFAVVRFLCALFPAVALRYPTKKWAALIAALAALGYLMISGGSVPTVRAFVMIAVMFAAVLLDRPALGIRNVALAALLILVVTPESVLDIGFQMSFAAVTCLIAAYEAIRERRNEEPDGFYPARRVGVFFGGIVLSTLIASIAVAPFAIYHFHHSQQYAILANLIALPVCNLIVMPAALATLLFMPLGLEAIPLAAMGWGIGLMSETARSVAALPGGVLPVPAIPEAAFGLMIAGGLWIALWRTRLRLAGLAAIAAALALAPTLPRPDMLVGADASLVALRDADGRLALLTARGVRFEARRGLEHDGDARTPAEAARGRAFTCDGSGCTARSAAGMVAIARHPSAVAEDCRRAAILIAAQPAPRACLGPRVIVDANAVRQLGPHALYFEAGGKVRVDTVAARRGNRPWARASATRNVSSGE